jgi:hypothetical protein
VEIVVILVVSAFIVVVDFLKRVIAETRGTECLVVAAETPSSPAKRPVPPCFLFEMGYRRTIASTRQPA